MSTHTLQGTVRHFYQHQLNSCAVAHAYSGLLQPLRAIRDISEKNVPHPNVKVVCSSCLDLCESLGIVGTCMCGGTYSARKLRHGK